LKGSFSAECARDWAAYSSTFPWGAKSIGSKLLAGVRESDSNWWQCFLAFDHSLRRYRQWQELSTIQPLGPARDPKTWARLRDVDNSRGGCHMRDLPAPDRIGSAWGPAYCKRLPPMARPRKLVRWRTERGSWCVVGSGRSDSTSVHSPIRPNARSRGTGGEFVRKVGRLARQ
jgi:hypothetical protein